MGWIHKRHMEQGGSIGTGPRGGKHKGPLRKITQVFRSSTSLFDTDWVLLECGHEGPSHGGQSARCATCGKEGVQSFSAWLKLARSKAKEYDLHRVPMDLWREQWAVGNAPQQAVEQIRLRLH